MKRVRYHIFLAALISAMAWSCSDSADGNESYQLCQNIVSFEGNGIDGLAAFSYRQHDDSPLITLTAPVRLSDEVEVGQRLLMRYTLPEGADPAASGKVNLVGLWRVLTDTVTIASTAPENQSAIALTSIHRSGEYLNLQMQAEPVEGRKIVSTAVVDASRRCADVYMWLEMDRTVAAWPTATYASVMIAPVWQMAEIDSVAVHINNSTNPYRNEFIFRK